MNELSRIDNSATSPVDAESWGVETVEAAAPILFRPNVDNRPRWLPGQRFEHLFEMRADILAASDPAHLAIDSDEAQLTYGELDGRANQLAHHLRQQGLDAGDRIALLFDKSIFSYVATLAVLKIGAAYVPLDGSFPAERIAFIASDAEISAILSLTRFGGQLAEAGVPVLALDELVDAIATESKARPNESLPSDSLAYIIYTSGSTGKPKGVPINHSQIVNFVQVAAETYGIAASDRMYQGLTIAFDFAVEEIWVPLSVGATLVPGPIGSTLVGSDLGEFLRAKDVTALCCVPTLLATLDADLPGLRYIMVSGEACPQDLVARWQRPGRRFLNAYGPTEATVTATLNEMVAGKPVTIGKPLPTYAIVVLDPNENKLLPFGTAGEIGIAGIGIATGYLNREAQTKKAFISDFVGIDHNTSGRIYRTGDLGRVNTDGDVEYLGRIDTQVKIRGYRIELTEIESVLMQFPGIAQAVVDKYEPTPGAVELAAWFTLQPGADFHLDAMVTALKAGVPSYMVPAYFIELKEIPLLPSHKADRKSLPKPTGRYAVSSANHVAPAAGFEAEIATALGKVLGLATMSATDNFFSDLGANSLLMARFITALRDIPATAGLSMRDLYANPTICELAAAAATSTVAAAPVLDDLAPHKAGTFAYVMTGVAQIAAMSTYALLGMWLLITGIIFVTQETGPLDLFLRAIATMTALGAIFTLLPVALKWLLIGRFTAKRIPAWSFGYLRFWIVKQLIRRNPMVLFVGSPLYTFYLRLLGARIGRNVTIHSASIPVAADLISIGDDTIILKDAMFSAYRVRAGHVETGPVTIGARAFVSEATVLDINSSMGDDAQLGHTSSLQSGQSVPDGARYHGSPAEPTKVDFDRAGTLPVSPLRRTAYVALQLLMRLVVAIPVPLLLLDLAAPQLFDALRFHAAGLDVSGVTPSLAGWLIVWASAGYFGLLFVQLAILGLVPRLANVFLKPGVSYPLFGFHYAMQQLVSLLSNSRGFNLLFGDSSYIVQFLQLAGYNLKGYTQTGSNFGAQQKHDNPFLCAVGEGTLISDGLTMANAEMSATAFRLTPIRIGSTSFLGNNVFMPAGGKLGDNVLLATKVGIPVDGVIRENVGLLGSPAFEIPRSVKRDDEFAHLRSGREFEARLRRKNLSNLITIGLYLLTRWALFVVTTALFFGAYLLQGQLGAVGYTLAGIAAIIVSAGWYILIERLTLGFGKLTPKTCSIYEPYYWFHERHWKMSNSTFRALFNGTPLKPTIWRLLGTKVGRQLLDDGASMSERSLVSIGDYCTLGDLSMIEGHSMEDGAFKSDTITIGNGVTIGANAFINYGVEMGEGSRLLADSFLMKGTNVPANALWGGNPARPM
ncbi:MAG: Pls/PosA family non-ribosomal peptide synthetase [Devosia sp.]